MSIDLDSLGEQSPPLTGQYNFEDKIPQCSNSNLKSSHGPKQSRDRWSNRPTFLLAAIGSAVGLGNLWRFPYLNYKHGGGAFLLPYFICLFVIGIPVLLLELGLGQIFQGGHAEAMARIHPRLRGFGVASAVTAFLIVVYYNAILAWSLVYFLSCFSRELAWVGGPEKAEEFFSHHVLELSEGPQHITKFAWMPENAIVLVWIMLYFATRNGVKSSGWVVRWTVPLPLVLLVAMLVHGITKPGAQDGIVEYIGKWELGSLSSGEVWQDAAGQIFFTLSVSVGIMSAYSSWNDRASPNLVQDNFIISISNSAISIFAGFAVYSVLGAMAHVKGTEVASVVTGGPGLVFVTYPEGLGYLPGSHLFSCLFFLTLLSLGLDSAMSMLEALACVLRDSSLGAKIHSSHSLHLALCFLGLLMSLLFTTDAGLHYLDILDHFLSSYAMLFLGWVECVAVGWVFEYPAAERRVGRGVLTTWIAAFTTASILLIVLALGLPSHLSNGTSDGWKGTAIAFGVFAFVSMAGLFMSLYKFTREKGLEFCDIWASSVLFSGAGDFVSLYRLHTTGVEQRKFPKFTRRSWEEIWSEIGWMAWAVTIKYIAPVLLLFLMASGVRKDVKEAYGSYPPLYLFLGGMLPVMLVLTLGFIGLFRPNFDLAAYFDIVVAWGGGCYPQVKEELKGILHAGSRILTPSKQLPQRRDTKKSEAPSTLSPTNQSPEIIFVNPMSSDFLHMKYSFKPVEQCEEVTPPPGNHVLQQEETIHLSQEDPAPPIYRMSPDVTNANTV